MGIDRNIRLLFHEVKYTWQPCEALSKRAVWNPKYCYWPQEVLRKIEKFRKAGISETTLG